MVCQVKVTLNPAMSPLTTSRVTLEGSGSRAVRNQEMNLNLMEINSIPAWNCLVNQCVHPSNRQKGKKK